VDAAREVAPGAGGGLAHTLFPRAGICRLDPKAHRRGCRRCAADAFPRMAAWVAAKNAAALLKTPVNADALRPLETGRARGGAMVTAGLDAAGQGKTEN
jgi:hypothetical protein